MPQQTLAQRVRAKYPGAYDDLSDQQLEQQVKAKFPGVYDDLPTTPAGEAKTPTPKGATGGYGALATLGDVMLGVAKSPLALVESGGKLLRSIPGVQAASEAIGETTLPVSPTPTSTAQQVGRVAGDIATGFLPAGLVTRAARGAAAAVPAVRGAALARPVVRGAVEAAGAGSIAAAQGYDPTLPAVAGGALGAAGGVVSGVRRAMRNPNAVEREALEYVQSQGVPVDAGTLSGNAALKGTRYLADRTIGGAAVATRAAQEEAIGLTRIGADLAKKASVTPSTPESAGRSIQQAIAQRVTELHDEANAAYDALRALEPANTQQVVVGTKASASGLVKDSIPITEAMAFPVDLTGAKAALRPVWERLHRQMPITQQEASPGLRALDNLMSGPDVAPASVVDRDLSVIKSIARQASRPELRDVGQGVSARAVGELDRAVQQAIVKGGPTATAALQAGRQATRAKYLAADVADSLREEPVKAFRQATEAKDAAIDQLRELQKLAPREVPKIGRAYLEDLLSQATREGGFGGAAGMAKKWADLGTETKNLLFPVPGLVPDLNKFFLAAKRLAENPNPSGTGGIVSIGTQGGLLYADPVLGMTVQLAGPVLSSALRNPRIVRLLTAGTTAKPNSVTSQALRASLAPLLGQEPSQ